MCHVCCIAVASEEECAVHLNAKRRQFGTSIFICIVHYLIHDIVVYVVILPLFIKLTLIRHPLWFTENERVFEEMMQEIGGARDFSHAEDKLTKVCQTVVVWSLKDFLRYKK